MEKSNLRRDIEDLDFVENYFQNKEKQTREEKHWYHDPKTGKYHKFFDDEVPFGWKKGSGKHWYTNPNKMFSCLLSDELVPNGYIFGNYAKKIKTKEAKKLDPRIVR